MNTRDFVIEDDSIFSDEDSEDPRVQMKAEIKREFIEKLAAEWNNLNTKREIRSFRSREEVDEEGEFLSEQCQEEIVGKIEKLIKSGQTSFTEEEYENYRLRRWRHQQRQIQLSEKIVTAIQELESKFETEFYDKIKEERERESLRIVVVEELLAKNGARMMRPYEHWNEEEKLMEYLERDRDYE